MTPQAEQSPDGRRDDRAEPKPGRWARDDLAGELARARDPLTPSAEPVSTARLSEVAQELERMLRARASSRPSPTGAETDRPWKRAVRVARDRLTGRPTRRYDWTAVGIATIATSLAQRLERVEEELLRLRRAIDHRHLDEGRPEGTLPAGEDPEAR
jgi:hypothetical protein